MFLFKNFKSCTPRKQAILVPAHTHTLQYNLFSTKQPVNMPLVVPGINSNDGSKTEEWTNKLVGKKIGESSDATVCSMPESLRLRSDRN